MIFTSQQVCAGLGLATLRFNFRGVGASAGRYDDAQGEQADARAALAVLAAALPDAPLYALGFSFGAWIALKLAVEEARVSAVVALGTPVDWAALDALIPGTKPRLFIHGEDDQFCDPVALTRAFTRFAPPKRLEWISGADHFFTNRLPALSRTLQAHFPLPAADWLQSPPA